MNIKLTDQEKNFLKQYAEIYDSERKIDITADPIVAVEEREYIPSCAGYQDEDIFVVNIDGEYDEYATIDELLEEVKIEFFREPIEELECGEEFTCENIIITKMPVKKIYRPVAYFLTRAEAERYCKYQSHNLKNPRVFTWSCGYSNRGDLKSLSKLLLRIGKELIESERDR